MNRSFRFDSVMLWYLARRLALAGVMLFGLVCLTFVIANVAPSDPAALAAGPDAGRSQIEQARREYGLDKPLPEQFLRYVGDLAQGEFGRSVATGRSVGRDLGRYFPATLELCLVAMTIGLGGGTCETSQNAPASRACTSTGAPLPTITSAAMPMSEKLPSTASQ